MKHVDTPQTRCRWVLPDQSYTLIQGLNKTPGGFGVFPLEFTRNDARRNRAWIQHRNEHGTMQLSEASLLEQCCEGGVVSEQRDRHPGLFRDDDFGASRLKRSKVGSRWRRGRYPHNAARASRAGWLPRSRA